jgi:hypothetical protein
MKSLLVATALALPLVVVPAAENNPAPDKSGYTFFNPTPQSQLRELNPDRPDLTESPYTVDAGWWQLEMDFFAYTRDHDTSGGNDLRVSALSFANINLRVGLTPRVDLQTIFEPYTRVRVTDRISGEHTSVSGFGDVTSRVKINFWGDDGGDSAFGLMPFVKWPTNQHGLGNHSVEGGLIVPYARSLPGDWDVGAMTEIDVVRNEADDGYTTAWVNSITLGHDIVGKLGGYVELASTLSRGAGQASFDCGLTYGIGKNVQIDAGATFGLTRAADDLTVFSGLSVRF